MSYEKSVPFNGNVRKAFEVARNTLLPYGFIIVENDDDYMEMTGPNTLKTKGQDPIYGISKISISAENNELTIQAEFGVVWKVLKLITVSSIGMCIFFLVLIGVVFHKQGVSMYRFLLHLAPFLAFPITIPLVGLRLKSRASKSLDALLNNMAVLGKEK